MKRSSRRGFLSTCAAAGAASAVSAAGLSSSAFAPADGTNVVVVGAGAFGGWSALNLLQMGARVTLVDAWGPGNSRASSGGETRLIRSIYGSSRLYTEMAAHSLRLWQDFERRWDRRLFHQTGALWMAGEDDSYGKLSLPILRDMKVAVEEYSAEECTRRWPQIDFQGVRWAAYEPGAGYLTARWACELVLEAFQRQGGTCLEAEARTPEPGNGVLSSLQLAGNRALEADQFVFACGPWLGKVLPFLSELIRPTRQEMFYFGTPAGDSRFSEGFMPAWVDQSTRLFYGMPGNQWRGFKLADDTRGSLFDPTDGDRQVSPEGLASVRSFLARRFPPLRDAPLLETRVCQYENSPDENFILDRHPEAENVWIVGGGSGHGFKHGPAVGEMVASAVLGKRAPPSEFALSRLLEKG